MKPALPTASVAYGLNGPSATAIVDNATPAGLHLSSGKNCPNKRDRLLVVVAQLSNLQFITLDAINHTVLIRDAA